MADLSASLKIAAAGMSAQSARMRVTSENLANAESTGSAPGQLPFQRKTIAFESEFDRALGAELVKVARYGVDSSDLPTRFEPNHPAADEDGYVQYPNVNPLVELMDMREAQRTFEANLNAMKQARTMMQQLIDLLRS